MGNRDNDSTGIPGFLHYVSLIWIFGRLQIGIFIPRPRCCSDVWAIRMLFLPHRSVGVQASSNFHNVIIRAHYMSIPNSSSIKQFVTFLGKCIRVWHSISRGGLKQGNLFFTSAVKQAILLTIRHND